MDIEALAKKIRAAVMDSAEDQGRTFNASILDDVIAKELRLHMPAPSAPSAYPWAVVPMTDNKVTFGFIGTLEDAVDLSKPSLPAVTHGLTGVDLSEWR